MRIGIYRSVREWLFSLSFHGKETNFNYLTGLFNLNEAHIEIFRPCNSAKHGEKWGKNIFPGGA